MGRDPAVASDSHHITVHLLCHHTPSIRECGPPWRPSQAPGTWLPACARQGQDPLGSGIPLPTSKRVCRTVHLHPLPGTLEDHCIVSWGRKSQPSLEQAGCKELRESRNPQNSALLKPGRIWATSGLLLHPKRNISYCIGNAYLSVSLLPALC